MTDIMTFLLCVKEIYLVKNSHILTELYIKQIDAIWVHSCFNKYVLKELSITFILFTIFIDYLLILTGTDKTNWTITIQV